MKIKKEHWLLGIIILVAVFYFHLIPFSILSFSSALFNLQAEKSSYTTSETPVLNLYLSNTGESPSFGFCSGQEKFISPYEMQASVQNMELYIDGVKQNGYDSIQSTYYSFPVIQSKQYWDGYCAKNPANGLSCKQFAPVSTTNFPASQAVNVRDAGGKVAYLLEMPLSNFNNDAFDSALNSINANKPNADSTNPEFKVLKISLPQKLSKGTHSIQFKFGSYIDANQFYVAGCDFGTPNTKAFGLNPNSQITLTETITVTETPVIQPPNPTFDILSVFTSFFKSIGDWIKSLFNFSIVGATTANVGETKTFQETISNLASPDTDYSDGSVERHFAILTIVDSNGNVVASTNQTEILGNTYSDSITYKFNNAGKYAVVGLVAKTTNTWNTTTAQWNGWTTLQQIAEDKQSITVSYTTPTNPNVDILSWLSSVINSIVNWLKGLIG